MDNRLDSIENRLDSMENRLDNLELESKATKQLVQNFKWDIDLLTDKQAKTEMAVNRLEKKLDTLTIHNLAPTFLITH
jgi:archaellum component FlaC